MSCTAPATSARINCSYLPPGIPAQRPEPETCLRRNIYFIYRTMFPSILPVSASFPAGPTDARKRPATRQRMHRPFCLLFLRSTSRYTASTRRGRTTDGTIEGRGIPHRRYRARRQRADICAHMHAARSYEANERPNAGGIP